VTCGLIRVVIVDDHRGMREAARILLSRRGYDVVGEADGAAAAYAVVARLDPDAVVLDIGLGADSGFDVCWALTALYPDLSVLLTSADPRCHDPRRVTEVGARGFVAKDDLLSADLGAYLRAAA
jgi:two-component system response regulator EvgA